MDHRRQPPGRQAPAGRSAGQDARMAGRRRRRGQAGRLGYLARRPLFRHRDSRRAGQVFLCLAGRAGGLPGLAEILLRGQGPGLRRAARPGRPDRAGALHRQGHHLLPRAVLAGDAEVRRAQDARPAECARFHHRQRREDVQEPRHRHLAAALPGNRHGRRMAALLHGGQAERARRGHGLQPRRLRGACQQRPGGQVRQHRQPRRRLHYPPLRRRTGVRRRHGRAGGRVRAAGRIDPRRLRGARVQPRGARNHGPCRPHQPGVRRGAAG